MRAKGKYMLAWDKEPIRGTGVTVP
jgi:hypothetical protein